MDVLSNLNLNKNELQNARIQNLATAPGTPVTGQVYHDTTIGCIRQWNGTAWVNLDATKATGIPLAALAEDFDTRVRTSRLDQMAAPTNPVSLNNQKITNLATPALASDAATKDYVDNSITGTTAWKDEVRVATVIDGNLANEYEAGDTVDGVVLALGDRILIKDYATPAYNGIYTVNASGYPTRALDSDTGDKITGTAVFVKEGAVNGGTRWVCNTTGDIIVNTTPLTFVSFGGGASYTAGNGLTLTGNEFNVGAGTGISVTADAIALDTAVAVRKYVTNIGDGSSTDITVTHNLANADVSVSVFKTTGGAQVMVDIERPTANTALVKFAVAPAAGEYRVVCQG